MANQHLADPHPDGAQPLHGSSARVGSQATAYPARIDRTSAHGAGFHGRSVSNLPAEVEPDIGLAEDRDTIGQPYLAGTALEKKRLCVWTPPRER